MTTVYLAGGITGLSYEECTGWRNQANKVLTESGFTVLDPMRGKEHLKDEQDIKGSYQDDPSCNSTSIFRRDILDVNESDVLLVNLIGLKGIGTPFEMGYAYAKGKILVIVAPEKYMELEYKETFLVLSHYPFEVWNHSHHNSIHLHGHIHSTSPTERSKDKRRVDVGVDAWNYTPVSFDHIINHLNWCGCFFSN